MEIAMDAMERAQHSLYAQSKQFGWLVEDAKRNIRQAIETGGKWSISFSGGVDSTVMLDLIYSMGYPLDVHWGDEGWDYPQTLAFLAETEARYKFHLFRFRHMDSWRKWCEEMGRPDLACDPEALETWGNPLVLWDATWPTQKERLTDLHQRGYTGEFIGLLAAESKTRRLVLHGGNRPLYQVKNERGEWHCSPLAKWDKQAVWAYILGRGLSYNPVYDRLAELGVPLEYRRVGPLTCFRVLQYGSHGYVLRSGWGELFNQLASVFPKVREFS